MQRVRIGLTGLAFVFVLVLLAAIFTDPTEEEPITPNLIERQRLPGQAETAADRRKDGTPRDPLAELGVAPGGTDANTAATQPPPPAGADR
ncbi:MAG: hypothetical protein ACK4K7_05610 [Allosphingosinicella sp.]|uniref:hypothetical protein n=1 Tax=Allosphingosinicella sp. TaxID=2823234 RepID=UPI003956E54B